ncbi:hypothetical protein M2138_001013 [Dysgonomonadaceae bacterium PH5-43]|nr:hypothetical protein [Dysgonomonadaceae bacterium PH5-43]
MKTRLILTTCLLLAFAFSTNAQQRREIRKPSLEREFYQHRALFADNVYGSPSEDFDIKILERVSQPVIASLLTDMLNGNYPTEFRVQDYKCYLHPNVIAKQQKTGAYSQFENPTGIYFTKGDTTIVIMDRFDMDDNINLRITNFGKEGGNSTYSLRPGFNYIIPENNGTGYIQYFTENKDDEGKTVKAHIMGGKVNGYFDRSKHTNADWANLLNNAVAETMDILGERVQLCYSINSLKEYAADGERLVFLYDSIISMQHEIMGLNKYNKVPKNHIFGRVIWQGFMHADGIGAAFHDNTMKEVANPDKIPTSLWGIAHEFGHVNQVRPWMKWVGTTEVTNNIYSIWSQHIFDPENPKLEREVLKDYDGRIPGGRITAYMESAFIKNQEWLTQAGNDRWDRLRPRDWGGDHFVKLVPFWQLLLWYGTDLYADIFNKAIEREDLPKNDGEAQLEFIKTACDVTKTDLTDFFAHSGMLQKINKWVDDYTCAQMVIKSKDIEEVKKYASKYKKPSTPVMHYITANSENYYKNKLAVKGKTNEGFTKQEDGSLIIDNNAWQNVVAFETYKGDKLVKIAFAGAGSKDNKTTLVRCPKGTTRVDAVQWNGKRYTVLK